MQKCKQEGCKRNKFRRIVGRGMAMVSGPLEKLGVNFKKVNGKKKRELEKLSWSRVSERLIE